MAKSNEWWSGLFLKTCYYLDMKTGKNDERINFIKKYSDRIFAKDLTKYSKEMIGSMFFAVTFLVKNKFPKDYSLWLTEKVYKLGLSEKEIEEDYLPLLRVAVLNKDSISDIFAFASAHELSLFINETIEDEIVDSDNELGIFYDDNETVIAFPQTIRASIFLGNGTSWCTSRKDENNRFLDYAINDRILLFYVIDKNGDTKKDSMAKIAIGYRNDFLFNQESTVDSKNNKLSINMLEQKFGNKLDVILSEIENLAKEIGDEHPISNKIQNLAKEATTSLRNYRRIIKKEKYSKNYIQGIVLKILLYQNMEESVFMEILNDKDSSEYQKHLEYAKLSDDIINTIIEKGNWHAKGILSRNANLSKHYLDKLYDEGHPFTEEQISYNRYLPASIAIKIAKSGNENAIDNLIAMNHFPDELVDYAIRNYPSYLISALYRANSETMSEKQLQIIDKIRKVLLANKLQVSEGNVEDFDKAFDEVRKIVFEEEDSK
jgi:hypothetical protein